jgi:hypothetical protein
MSNLTFAQKLLKPHTVDPLDGHTVVVVERIGTAGEEFRFEIEPGQRLPRSGVDLFRFLRGKSRNDKYFAFAVNGDPELRATFSAPVSMDDHIHDFHLLVELAYHVSAPRLLVQRRNDDPFKKVREELSAALRRGFAPRHWETVCGDFRDVEQEVVDQLLGPLVHFASRYGLAVDHVGLEPRLNDGDVAPWVEAERIEATKTTVQLQGELERARLTVQSETATLGDRLAHDRRLDTKMREHDVETLTLTQQLQRAQLVDATDAHNRNRLVGDAYTEAAVVAIKTAGGAIRTPAELLQVMSAMRNASEQMRAIGGGSANIGLISSGTPEAQSGAAAILADMLATTEQIRCSLPARRQLQSAILHLIAELLRDDEADDEIVEDYRSTIDAFRSTPSLPLADHDYLRKFVDIDQLRRHLQ